MMQEVTDVVTVINSLRDDEEGFDRYYGTVLSGVHWFRTTKTSIGSSGNGGRSGSAGELMAADVVYVRVPVEAVEAAGKELVWKGEYTDPETQFTLHPGDLIVLGSVEVAEDLVPADLMKGPDAVTVLSVTDSSRARHAPHYKVVGS